MAATGRQWLLSLSDFLRGRNVFFLHRPGRWATPSWRSIISSALTWAAVLTAACGTTYALYRLIADKPALYKHSYLTFQDLRGLSPSLRLYRAWAPRVGSIALADRFADWATRRFDIEAGRRDPKAPWRWAIALWTAGWFAFAAVIYILAYREKSVLFFNAAFAGIAFGYLLDTRVYAWDMPAFTISTAATVLLCRHSPSPPAAGVVVALSVGGIFFKETSLLFALFPLFLYPGMRWRKRLAWTGALLSAGLVLKCALNLAVTGRPFTFAVRAFQSEESLWAFNLELLMREPVWLADAGLALALLLMPARGPSGKLFKTIAVLFTVANLMFGVATEYRIWFELIPPALATFYFNRRWAQDAASRATAGG